MLLCFKSPTVVKKFLQLVAFWCVSHYSVSTLLKEETQMNARHERLGEIVAEVSAYEVLVGCGVPILMASEDLCNDCEDIGREYALSLSHQLYVISSVLAAVCAQYERTLKTIVVHLPEDIGAVRIKNPLYGQNTTEPEDDTSGSGVDGGDDLPF